MARRTAEQRIVALEAQVAALKANVAAAKVRKDPALKFVSKAMRLIDTAAAETRDAVMRASLEEARATLSACLQLEGLVVGATAQRRTSRGGSDIDGETLLGYVRSNPGLRGEQIAAALGTDSRTMRPLMKVLIAEGKVRTQGERRGTTYSPA
jgi:hypothetical protein